MLSWNTHIWHNDDNYCDSCANQNCRTYNPLTIYKVYGRLSDIVSQWTISNLVDLLCATFKNTSDLDYH